LLSLAAHEFFHSRERAFRRATQDEVADVLGKESEKELIAGIAPIKEDDSCTGNIWQQLCGFISFGGVERCNAASYRVSLENVIDGGDKTLRIGGVNK